MYDFWEFMKFLKKGTRSGGWECPGDWKMSRATWISTSYITGLLCTGGKRAHLQALTIFSEVQPNLFGNSDTQIQ